MQKNAKNKPYLYFISSG